MNIAITLEKSLQQLAHQHTERTLGDRSTYLGASDVAGCPRRVILDKLNPPVHDLATLLRFQRGHMAEDIIAEAFAAAGYTNFQRQVEVFPNSNSPITAHLDFVFTSERNSLKSILEVKSSTNAEKTRNPRGLGPHIISCFL